MPDVGRAVEMFLFDYALAHACFVAVVAVFCVAVVVLCPALFVNTAMRVLVAMARTTGPMSLCL